MVSCMAQQPSIGPWPPVLQVSRLTTMFFGERLSVPRRTPQPSGPGLCMYDPRRHWVARELGSATSRTHNNREPLRGKSDMINKYCRHRLQLSRVHLRCISLNICDNDVSTPRLMFSKGPAADATGAPQP